MEKLLLISDNAEKFSHILNENNIPFDVVNPTGDRRADWLEAVKSGADYVFYCDENAEISEYLIKDLWDERKENPIVMGDSSSQNKFTSWLMKMLASYFCQVFVNDACPPFVFAERERLEETLSYVKESLNSADGVLACNAAYRGEEIKWVECTCDNRSGKEVSFFLRHIFKQYTSYQHAGENMMKDYSGKDGEEINRNRNTAFDKLLGLINHEIVSYVFFGVLTTVVSIGTFEIFRRLLGEEMFFGKYNYLFANVISWVFAVLFAFFTNKLFVFNSRTWKPSVVAKEFSSFVTARLVSLGIDTLLMFAFVDLIHMSELLAKLIVQVVVVILNYVFSKLFIFRTGKK